MGCAILACWSHCPAARRSAAIQQQRIIIFLQRLDKISPKIGAVFPFRPQEKPQFFFWGLFLPVFLAPYLYVSIFTHEEQKNAGRHQWN
jgi:hypothetical protein